MLTNSPAYRITVTDKTGAREGPKFVAVAVNERDTHVPTEAGLKATKEIWYTVNSGIPDRHILAGEVRREGDALYVEDLNPVFGGNPSTWWRWEPLTLERWKGMFPDITGYEELEQEITSDNDVINFYVSAFAPETIKYNP